MGALELAEAIWNEIAHGDDEHRAWLRDALRTSPAIAAFFAAEAPHSPKTDNSAPPGT